MAVTGGSGGFRPSLLTTSENVAREAAFLASEHHAAKRVGVTLDASVVTADGSGDKVVKAGTLVAKITANGKYGPYATGAADGRQTLDESSGYLWETVNLRNGDVIAGLLLHGSVLAARVTPAVTAAIRTGVAGRIWFQ